MGLEEDDVKVIVLVKVGGQGATEGITMRTLSELHNDYTSENQGTQTIYFPFEKNIQIRGLSMAKL